MAETINLEPSKLIALSNQREKIILIIKKLNESNALLDALQAQLNVNQESVRVLEIKSKDAHDNLEKKQKYDRENPGEITDKLPQAQEQNRQATITLKEAKTKIVEIKHNLIEENKNLSTLKAQYKKARQFFDSDIDSLVGKQLHIKVAKLQVAKKIEARGQVSCGEDSMRVCKERSKKEAERNQKDKPAIGVCL